MIRRDHDGGETLRGDHDEADHGHHAHSTGENGVGILPLHGSRRYEDDKAGEGADPAAVIFDTVKSATARGYDMVIADTAGRLHNKANLMGELAKISRSVKKAAPDASLETLLVLDAITGQNAISQAKEFCKAASATGIILTKLDGTAKGGCVVAVKQRLGLPVRFIGVGEGIDDLIPFTPEGFVEELIPRTGWKH